MEDPLFLNAENITLVSFYAQTLREPLFTTLLGVSALILAAKTYIVVLIKEKVIDNPKYREAKIELIKLTAADSNEQLTEEYAKIKLYQPLVQLSKSLSLGVAVTLFAGVLQFTLGLFRSETGVVICLTAVVIAILVLFQNMYSSYSKMCEYYKYCMESDEIDLSDKE